MHFSGDCRKMPVSRLHQGRFRAISSRLPKPYRQIYLSQVCHSGIRPVKISSSGKNTLLLHFPKYKIHKPIPDGLFLRYTSPDVPPVPNRHSRHTRFLKADKPHRYSTAAFPPVRSKDVRQANRDKTKTDHKLHMLSTMFFGPGGNSGTSARPPAFLSKHKHIRHPLPRRKE